MGNDGVSKQERRKIFSMIISTPVFQRTPDAAGAILLWMSRAFVKEDVDRPERSGRKRSASGLPPGASNYITARGAKRLRDELQKLRAANAASERVTELEQILASVHLIDPPDAPSNSVGLPRSELPCIVCF